VEFVTLDLFAEWLPRPEDVKLADEFFQGLRSNAVGQRRAAPAVACRRASGRWLKEAHRNRLIGSSNHRVIKGRQDKPSERSFRWPDEPMARWLNI
jgi:hypothetical protein